MKYHPRFIFLSVLLLGASATLGAVDAPSTFESLAQAKYQALSADYTRNPSFKSASLNQGRDGVASPYIQRNYGEDYNNAAPYAPAVLERIVDFHMLPYKVFRLAFLGYQNILRNQRVQIKNQNVLTVVNFDESIQSRRLYVFDLKNNRVLFNTFVAHGYKSDENFDGIPERFSNTPNSNESSVGFFLTGVRAGPSSHFRYMTPVMGIDGSLNDQAQNRAILIHEWKALDINTLGGASRWSPLYGATEGCFGLPAYDSGRFYGLPDRPLNDLIIDTILGRSLLFSYSSLVDLSSESLYLSEPK